MTRLMPTLLRWRTANHSSSTTTRTRRPLHSARDQEAPRIGKQSMVMLLSSMPLLLPSTRSHQPILGHLIRAAFSPLLPLGALVPLLQQYDPLLIRRQCSASTRNLPPRKPLTAKENPNSIFLLPRMQRKAEIP